MLAASTDWTSLVPIVVPIIGAIGAYLLAVRRFSGKIETSDAKDLWAESRDIRKELQARNAYLEGEIKQLKGRLDSVEGTNITLLNENRHLSEQVDDLTTIVARLRGEIAEQTTTITALREEISTLTGQLRESRDRVLELEDEGG